MICSFRTESADVRALKPRPAAHAEPSTEFIAPQWDADGWLTRMRVGYARRGGLLWAADVVRLLCDQHGQPVSVLAKWIGRREIVHVPWQSDLLIPMFQFRSVSGELRPVVRHVTSELDGARDERGIAQWFVENSAVLGGLRPLDLIGIDDPRVVDAARQERFIARG